MNIIRLISILVTLTLTLSLVSVHANQSLVQLDELAPSSAPSHHKVTIFVELNAPPTAQFVAAYVQKTGVMPSKLAQQDYTRNLDQAHNALINAIAPYEAVYMSTLKITANGIKFKVDEKHISDIRLLPGVKSVSLVQSHLTRSITANDVNHLDIVRASGLPQIGATGEGVVVAVIDTGIDYYLKSLGGNQDVGHRTDDGSTIEPGTFPTAKVIGGIDLAGSRYDSLDPNNNIPEPDNDPFDVFHHGSLVANIIAADPIDGANAGITPDVKLIAVKVFGDTFASSDLIADGIEYAIDPNRDGSLDDRADVINLSVGTDFGVDNNVDGIATENAILAGAVVVVAAGNAGNIPYVVGAPSTVEGAISVGATDDSVNQRLAFDFDGTEERFPATNALLTDTEQVFSGQIRLPPTIDACEPLPPGYEGSVVVFKYNDCGSFSISQQNFARDAGAAAAIIVNNRLSDRFLVSAFPTYQINSAYGERLLQRISESSVTIATYDPSFDAVLSDIYKFSSRGFAGRATGSFKPDVLAPGVQVSAGSSFALDGTSFSAPIVAGLAAAILQENPQFSPQAVKASILNSTRPMQAFDYSGAPFEPVSLQGVGLIQADKALALTSYAAPAGLGFGIVNTSEKIDITRTFTIHNLRNERRHFSLAHTSGQSLPGVTLRYPRAVHIPANATKTVNIRMVVDPRHLPSLQNGIELVEVDGWLTVSDIYDTLQLAYGAAVEAASDIKVDIAGSGFIVSNNARKVGPAVAFAKAILNDVGVTDEDKIVFPNLIGYRLDANNNVLSLNLTYPQSWSSPNAFLRAVELTASAQDGSTLGFARFKLADSGFFNGDQFIPITDRLVLTGELASSFVTGGETDLFQSVVVNTGFNRRTMTLDIALNNALASYYPSLSIQGIYLDDERNNSVLNFSLSPLGENGLALPELLLEKNETVTTSDINVLNTDVFWLAPENDNNTLIQGQ